MAKISLNLMLPSDETRNFVGTWDVVNEDLEVVREGAFLDSMRDELDLPQGEYWIRIHLPNNRVETRKLKVDAPEGTVDVGFDYTGAAFRKTQAWPNSAASEAPGLLSGSRNASLADDLWLRCYVYRNSRWEPTDDAVEPEVQNNDSAIQLQISPRESALIALQIGGAHFASRFVVLPPQGTSYVLIASSPAKRESTADLDAGDSLEIAVSLRNSVADHLARFLIFGSDGSRQRIDSKLANQEGLTLMMEKNADPLGAAVGGYFLAQDLEYGSGPRVPLDWFGRLSTAAPWLADGPILLASALIAQLGEQGASRAIDALQMAASRAYPVIRRGARMYIDTYQRLIDADVALPDTLHAHARLLARVGAADTRQTVFTTFYGAEPGNPDRQLVLNSESADEFVSSVDAMQSAEAPRRLNRTQKIFTGLGSRLLSKGMKS